jgi:hypothetical protein
MWQVQKPKSRATPVLYKSSNLFQDAPEPVVGAEYVKKYMRRSREQAGQSRATCVIIADIAVPAAADAHMHSAPGADADARACAVPAAAAHMHAASAADADACARIAVDNLAPDADDTYARHMHAAPGADAHMHAAPGADAHMHAAPGADADARAHAVPAAADA